MAQWKLGTGDAYASLSGFTWPTNENPNNFDLTRVVKIQTNDLDTREGNYGVDLGINSAAINITGRLSTEANLRSLEAQATKGRYFFSNGKEQVDLFYEQKFYPSDEYFYYVRRGQFKQLRQGSTPLLQNYTLSLPLSDPFRYENTITDETASGSSGTTTAIAIGGNVFNLPEFDFEVSTGTVTKLVITASTGGTITISGLSLTAGEIVTVVQRMETCFLYNSSGTLIATDQPFSGRIAVDTGLSPTFSFTATGGTGTFTATVRNRYLG